jgi:drug/metabolite transporter superfamily protein YnfA
LKISNKKKFIVRVIEIAIIIATIILTILAINYANKIRGYQAYGGEYLIPIIGLLIVMVIEDIYQESEKKRKKAKHGKK